MIKSISVTNHRGETLDIDLRNPWGSGLAVSSITGLNPPRANINATELSSMDGSVYNSARVVKRNIVIDFYILEKLTIEQARHILYKYFPIKKQLKFRVKTDERDVYTTGYVESNNVGVFAKMESAQVSIICPDPYFYSSQDVSVPLNDIIGGFEFPFENPVGTESLHFGEISVTGPVNIIYAGETSAGVNIDIHATGEVGNLRIYSVTTDQEILLDVAKLAAKTGDGIIAGDSIHINTNTGHKEVTLTRAGVKYNILSCVSLQTGWIRLDPGDNIIVYSAIGIQNAQIYVTNKIVYEGV